MRLRWPQRGLIAIAALVAVAGCSFEHAAPAPKTGAPLPVIRAADIAGAPVTSDDYRGRVLVLHVWAVWCAPCRHELPSLDRLQRRLDASRYAVVALSVDDDAVRIREYLSAIGAGLSAWHDAQPHPYAALGVRRLPASFIVDADGVLVHALSGPQAWESSAMQRLLERVQQQSERTATAAPRAADRRLARAIASMSAEPR